MCDRGYPPPITRYQPKHSNYKINVSNYMVLIKNKNNLDRYFTAVKYLEGLTNIAVRDDFFKRKSNPEIFIKRTEFFLNLLGNPENYFKYIHITGTAGKGTVSNAIHTALVLNRARAGVFTSPHTTTSIERIKVDERYIDPIIFADIINEIKPTIDLAYTISPYGGPSYFEVFFAIALLYFKKMKCKWVVLEVGLGGQYDATNIIKKPLITAITNINLDHTEVLGKTLTKIAQDKAGIIKNNCDFFTTESRPHLLRLFRKICRDKKAKFYLVGSKKDNYQDKNTKLVLSICEKIGINRDIIFKSLAENKLPCRFEKVQVNPVVILDGAHNPIKMASTLSNVQKIHHKNLHIIIGIAQNKNIEEILSIIAPLAKTITATTFRVEGRKCTDPLVIVKLANKINKKAQTQIIVDPKRAYSEVLKKASRQDTILVTGSFFLTGELRELWYPEENVLANRSSF